MEIFSEVVCLYTAVKGAYAMSVECRTKNEKPNNTDKKDNNNNNGIIYDNEGNKYEDEVIHDKSVNESDNFLDAYYCHFVTLTSPPGKQLIQSFQNMKKSLLVIINYSTECNTVGLSALLPLPKHYHDLLPKKVQFSLGERKIK